MHSHTQHGGSSGISKTGNRRDPNKCFIIRQDLCLKERSLCLRGSLIALSHKRENAHINLKCSKAMYRGKIR